jgi:hypothetical protein
VTYSFPSNLTSIICLSEVSGGPKAGVKRERLFARIPPPRAPNGISPQDIGRISVDSTVVDDLLDCLRSDDDLDAGFGLYFAEHLRPRPDFCAVAEPSFPALASLIRDSLTHSNSQVRVAAIGALVAFRESYEGDGAVMRAFLRSPEPAMRREALRAAPSFLSAKELGALLPFRDDTVFIETGGMGGPLRYDLRDYALEVAEHIAQRRFDSGDCMERREGSTIYWRSWGAFTRWLETQKTWRIFRRGKVS